MGRNETFPCYCTACTRRIIREICEESERGVSQFFRDRDRCSRVLLLVSEGVEKS